MAPEEIDLYNDLETKLGRELLTWVSHPGFDYTKEPKMTSPSEYRQQHARRGGPSRGRRSGASSARSSKPSRLSIRSDSGRKEEQAVTESSTARYGRIRRVAGSR